MIVIIGFVPEEVGKALPSPIQTPLVSCSSPRGSATEVFGSGPIRQLPIWWALKSLAPPARSGIRLAPAMNASRSSPRRQLGAPVASTPISWAPAASCSRTWTSMPWRRLRTSTSSVTE